MTALIRSLLVALTAVTLAACGAADAGNPGADTGAGEQSAAGDEVVIDNMRFTPQTLEVPAGTTVTWLFEDATVHDVVGDGWGSQIQSDGAFSHTFDEAGTYDYVCTLHTIMTGQIIVTE